MIGQIVNNTLVKKSFPLFLGTMVANVFNYLFHISMGRLLGPEEFGVFISILSFIIIISILPTTVQLVVTKITAQYKARDDYQSIYSLFVYLSKKLFILGIILFLLGLIILRPLASFLKIPSSTLFIAFLIIPSSFFLLGITRGALRGLQSFRRLGLNISMEGITKFIFGTILALVGLKSMGAIGGIVLALVFIYLLSVFQLKPLFKNKSSRIINLKGAISFSFWAFFLIFLTQWIFNFDIILVKHYLSADTAGLYSALATLGKILLIFSLAVIGVMFPIIIEKRERKENFYRFLRQSLFLVSLLSISFLIIFMVFPKTLIMIFFGQDYLPISPYLGLFGITIYFFNLASVFLYYFLAIKKEKMIFSLAIAILLQIILITLFHQSMVQIIIIMFSLMLGLLLFLIIYYYIARKRFLTFMP